MNCATFEILLDDYLDTSLEPIQREAVERHLSECDSCRRETERLQSLLSQCSLLRRMPRRELWPSISAEISLVQPRAAENGVISAPAPAFPKGHFNRRIAWLIAAAVTLVIAGLMAAVYLVKRMPVSGSTKDVVYESGQLRSAVSPPATPKTQNSVSNFGNQEYAQSDSGAVRPSQSALSRYVFTTPYTVVLQEIAIDAEGHGRVASIQLRAVRSDGSNVLRMGDATNGGRMVFLAGESQRININPRRLVKSTQFSPWHPGHTYRDPKFNCLMLLDGTKLAGTLVGEEFVAGYRAAKIVNEAAGSTVWLSLDYGCAPLKSKMDFGKESSETTLVSFVAGEPDPALFEVPANYTEGPPSMLLDPTKPEYQPSIDKWKQIWDEEYRKYHR